jgi:hypothetical protein
MCCSSQHKLRKVGFLDAQKFCQALSQTSPKGSELSWIYISISVFPGHLAEIVCSGEERGENTLKNRPGNNISRDGKAAAGNGWNMYYRVSRIRKTNSLRYAGLIRAFL